MPSSAVLLSLLLAVGAHAGLYPKSSPVIQVDAKSYDSVIAKSNHTSIVEFYAPWCGHCQNLKPAYEKAASNLAGLANVAAVDCDEESNKPLCGSMGVQGFPTLKIVRPGKKGKPVVEDYQGQRSASAIVEAVVDRMNNHVTKLTDKNADEWLAKEGHKAVLFTEKGTTGALLKSIATDFLDAISVAQVRNKESKTVEKFGIDDFPSLVLIPSGAEPIVYEGEMKKPAMVEFLSQAAPPNGPAAKESKPKGKSSKSKTKTTTAEEETQTEEAEKVQQTAPVVVDVVPVAALNTPEKLTKECFNSKSHTCVLAFTPSEESESSRKALDTMAALAHRHSSGKKNLIPFYSVPAENEASAEFAAALNVENEVEIVAVNAKRGWFRRYAGEDLGLEAVDSWFDAVRMGEGQKSRLPEGIVAEAEEPAAASESSETAESTGTETPEPAESEPADEHDELAQ